LVISIITATYNSESYIASCLDSLESQTFKGIEHIVIDGNSSDDTLKIISEHCWSPSKIISESDRGIYDALNKGFAMASGDIVGILHSDDKFAYSNTIEKIVKAFEDKSADFVYGDMRLVNAFGETIRLDKVGKLRSGKIKYKQIPHPSLFISREKLTKINPFFDDSYEISADLKQQLILSNKLSAKGFYLSEVIALQKIGGKSTRNFLAYLKGWRESARAWNEVMGRGGIFFVISKVLLKIKGYIFTGNN